MNLPSTETEVRKQSTLRLRAGLLLLVGFILMCAFGGYFVANKIGLGWGWAILIAVVIWVGIGIVLARMSAKVYYGLALVVTLLLAYLVYDFVTAALGWSSTIAAVLGAVATAFLAFTFHDFQRLKSELRRLVYRE
ncbi:hypothetical protein ACT6QG_06655 [Xanthobacter sp. TB0136]|uniref:hypothetical protein n=1 Tax=Xanthobacter sp. TB0136 TaxID=3459177 RepID=UPI004039C16D